MIGLTAFQWCRLLNCGCVVGGVGYSMLSSSSSRRSILIDNGVSRCGGLSSRLAELLGIAGGGNVKLECKRCNEGRCDCDDEATGCLSAPAGGSSVSVDSPACLRWVAWWVRRTPTQRKRAPHSLHLNGFSPECTRWWARRLSRRE